MRLDFETPHHIKLAVNVGMDQAPGLFAGHLRAPSAAIR
jgi:hypothetical protein